MAPVLPPTSADLTDPSCRPYFLWWTDATVGDLRRHLAAADEQERAYWTGALLREANTRDVWLYVTPEAIRAQWDRLLRHLGRSRERWAFLLGLDAPTWPPTARVRTLERSESSDESPERVRTLERSESSDESPNSARRA